jgi:DNA-binding protein Fis
MTKTYMKERFDALVDDLVKATFFMEEAVELLERTMIAKVLNTHQGNQSRASKALGIHRNTLQSKMTKYGLVGKRVKKKPPARANGRPVRDRAVSE